MRAAQRKLSNRVGRCTVDPAPLPNHRRGLGGNWHQRRDEPIRSTDMEGLAGSTASPIVVKMLGSSVGQLRESNWTDTSLLCT